MSLYSPKSNYKRPICLLRSSSSSSGSITFLCSFVHQNIPYLLSGSENGEISLWNLYTRRVITSKDLSNLHKSSILSLTFIKYEESSFFISSGRDNKCYLFKFDIVNNDPIINVLATISTGSGLSFCKSSYMIDEQVGSLYISVPCIDIPEQFTIHKLILNNGISVISKEQFYKSTKNTNNVLKGLIMDTLFISVLDNFNVKNDIFLAAYESGHIAIFDVKDTLVMRLIIKISEGPLLSICKGEIQSNENNIKQDYIAIGTSLGEIITINLIHLFNKYTVDINEMYIDIAELLEKDKSKCNSRIASIFLVEPQTGISSLKIRPTDGRVIVAGCWDSTFRIHGTKTAKQLAIIDDIHRKGISSIEFQNTSAQNVVPKEMFFVGSKDGNISVWDLYK